MRHKSKGKAIPVKAWTGPEDSRRMKLPHFMAIGTWKWWGCHPDTTTDVTPPRNIPGTHFC